MSNEQKEELVKETESDENFKKLKNFIEKGWPKNIKNNSNELNKFFQIKDE